MQPRENACIKSVGRMSRRPAITSREPDQSTAASDRMEHYCSTHPTSPSAMRRPQLLVYGGMCVALLGASIEEGIAGFGDNIDAALRAFDDHYLHIMRPLRAARSV